MSNTQFPLVLVKVRRPHSNTLGQMAATQTSRNQSSPNQSSRNHSCTQSAFRSLNQVVMPAVKAGFGGPLPVGNGLVILETVGRKSGKTRQVPLVASRLGDTVWVSTVRSNSLWVKNLAAEPKVQVWIGGRKRSATANILASEPLAVVSLTLD